MLFNSVILAAIYASADACTNTYGRYCSQKGAGILADNAGPQVSPAKAFQRWIDGDDGPFSYETIKYGKTYTFWFKGVRKQDYLGQNALDNYTKLDMSGIVAYKGVTCVYYWQSGHDPKTESIVVAVADNEADVQGDNLCDLNPEWTKGLCSGELDNGCNK